MNPEIEQMKIARDRDGLMKALDGPEAKIRFQAAEALGELRDVDDLCKVLAYEWYRPEAAELLGEIGDRSAVRHLLGYIDGSDNFTKDRTVLALGKLGGSEAVQAFRRMLKDDDPAIHSTVVTTLFGMDDPEAKQALRDLDRS